MKQTPKAIMPQFTFSRMLRSIGSTDFTITVNHNGRIESPYAFSPIVANLLRFVPETPWALFRVKWLFSPWPEMATP